VEKSEIPIDDELFYLKSKETLSSYSSYSFYSSYSSCSNGLLVSNWGGDEFDTIELIMALEEEFDLELSEEKCQEFTTVKKLVDYLAENLGK
jgi:acyl carrier protein